MNKTKFDGIHKDIALLCDYLAYDEKRHYEEWGCPRRNHIWPYIKRVKQWLKDNDKATL